MIGKRDHDWIRDTVKAHAAGQLLNAKQIAERTSGRVSDDQVRAYMAGRKTMGSCRLQHVLRVLNLTIRSK